ncbi:MAG: PQQ-binding-like beta-propeller repeat protein [Thermoplasmata archaeon]|nr:PQQ-binding-like beta-propeller repeat protein [Thermoplasmata archaeon]
MGWTTGRIGAVVAAVVILVSSLGLILAPSAAPGPTPSSPAVPPSGGTPTVTQAQLPPGGDWPTFLGSILRDSTPQREQLITESVASTLHPLWTFSNNASLESQPVVAGGVVYVGSLNGYEYALNSLTGSKLWSTYLGQDKQDPGCGTTAMGIVSTPTVSGNTLLLYGGGSRFYDLDTRNGNILWSVAVGNTSQGYFGWGSPLVHRAYAYVGVSSRCDHPLVPGGIAQISLATHQVLASFNTTAPGIVGNSVWTTPSLNGSSNTLFVTTGNPNATGPRGLGESILALNATTLKLLHYWQVPFNQSLPDGDFGSTPTLFTPTGGSAMVAAIDKNGIAYAWYQSNLTLAWEVNVSSSYIVSTIAWSGQHLYALGGKAVVGSRSYSSSVRELNPLNGTPVWVLGLNQSHTGYASPLWVNSALVVAENQTVQVLNAANGAPLVSFPLNGSVQAPPALSRGELYVATGHGFLYAFDLNLSIQPSQSPNFGGHAPLRESFSVSVQGGLPQYSYNWSFGDGSYSSAPSPVHTYHHHGHFSVTVTVTDLAGTSVMAQMTVRVR